MSATIALAVFAAAFLALTTVLTDPADRAGCGCVLALAAWFVVACILGIRFGTQDKDFWA